MRVVDDSDPVVLSLEAEAAARICSYTKASMPGLRLAGLYILITTTMPATQGFAV